MKSNKKLTGLALGLGLGVLTVNLASASTWVQTDRGLRLTTTNNSSEFSYPWNDYKDRNSKRNWTTNDKNERAANSYAADNTKRNVRDRDDRTLTPTDQSNRKNDRAITAQIRRNIMSENNMSINAQNVKIITSQGRVTLRGPVETSSERNRIGKIANRVADSRNVDNQLVVKNHTGSDKVSSR